MNRGREWVGDSDANTEAHEAPEHLTECDGNGTVDCCECGGEGFYSVVDDDICGEDEEHEYKCEACEGRGFFACPACDASLPPDDVSPETP